MFDPVMLNDDTTYDDVPTAEHVVGGKFGGGLGSPTFIAWLIVIGALGGLWLLGGIVFRTLNVH